MIRARSCSLPAVIAFATLVGCTFPDLMALAPDATGERGADGALDGADGSGTLITSEPAVVAPGQEVRLEGTFTADPVVRFPDGTLVTAELLGPHRAKLLVPATMPVGTRGELRLVTGTTLGPTEIAVVATTRVGEFTPIAISLAAPRTSAAIARGHQRVYVAGSSVEGASTAGGTLGAFAPLSANLGVPRSVGSAAVVIGDWLYVLGGNFNPTTTVERAQLDTSGDATSFSGASPLSTGVQGHCVVVIGDHLYVIGGADSTGRASAAIQRARIADDGTLGAFEPWLTGALATGLHGQACAVVEDSVYVLGGSATPGSGDQPQSAIEVAGITGDGGLLPFQGAGISLREAIPYGHSAGVVGNSAFVVAGYGTSGTHVETSSIADGRLASPQDHAPLASGHSGSVAIVVGDGVYVLGGQESPRSIERAPLD